MSCITEVWINESINYRNKKWIPVPMKLSGLEVIIKFTTLLLFNYVKTYNYLHKSLYTSYLIWGRNDRSF